MNYVYYICIYVISASIIKHGPFKTLIHIIYIELPTLNQQTTRNRDTSTVKEKSEISWHVYV